MFKPEERFTQLNPLALLYYRKLNTSPRPSAAHFICYEIREHCERSTARNCKPNYLFMFIFFFDEMQRFSIHSHKLRRVLSFDFKIHEKTLFELDTVLLKQNKVLLFIEFFFLSFLIFILDNYISFRKLND